VPEKINQLHSNITWLRSRVKGFPRDISWRLGPGRSFLQNKPGARMLVYHGICEKDPLQFNTLFISKRTFEAQLQLYKKYFNLVSLDDYYEERFSKNRFNLCLSFDDGFANNYSYVLPLLEKYQVPAVFFITGIRAAGYDILWNDLLSIAYKYGPAELVCCKEIFIKDRDGRYISAQTKKQLSVALRETGFNDKLVLLQQLGAVANRVPEDYWLQLTEIQIRKLSQSQWATIGSHGNYHNDLAKIPLADAAKEMLQSKSYLENITGKTINALAFPYGSYTKEITAAAKQLGYTRLLATVFNNKEDQNDDCLKERFTVNPFISNINQLYANINGHYR
jgi:peptidoglycan/xylan/chitin deacetylase (PgdA/CDA1 family)